MRSPAAGEEGEGGPTRKVVEGSRSRSDMKKLVKNESASVFQAELISDPPVLSPNRKL